MTTTPFVSQTVCRYGTWPHQQNIVSGAGATAALPDEIARTGASRVFLLTTASLRREGTVLDGVRESIGAALVGEFGECRAHNPREVILDAALQVRAAAPDLLVSFGGSTVTDTGKALNFAIAHGVEDVDAFDAVDLKGAAALQAPLIPQVAIPTTLSGAEYSAAAGITNVATHVKRVYGMPGLAPVTVLLDPDVTVATPERLWCATGVKSMSDSIEMLCYEGSHPFVRILTRAAFESFFRWLPESFSDDPDVRERARSGCQHAAWTSAYSLQNSTSKLGLGNSMRHQLGALGVGHGEATCIMLPHIVAFNWPVLGDVQNGIATALGIDRLDGEPVTAEVVGDRIKSFVASLGLPHALRDVAIEEKELPALAIRVMNDPMAAFNPRPVSIEDSENLLRAAY